MRILMLSWEYPPQSVGGLARHVEDLAISLARLRHDVHVLTLGRPGQVCESKENGVIVHRVEAYPVHAPDFLTWVLQLNARFLEEAMIIMRKYAPFQIIHAHDWLVAFTGRALKHAHRLPLIATIHATEAGRNRGLYNDMQRYINSVEWWLTYEAWRVIVCSQHMRQEVQGLFQLPADKITIIPNGVYSQNFRAVAVDPAVRQRYAAPHEKIIFFVGRLVIEKGVQVLLEAMPRILSFCPEAKLVVAGQGPMEGQLQNRARELGISHKVYFAGYIDDHTRNQLYRAARVAVFPSLYEPFGIVALEAMAAGTPVVASETGGLAEIITHGVDGMLVFPGNATSLADNILAVLKDDALADTLRANGRRLVREVYDWENIARRTVDVYQEVYNQYRRTSWPERPSVVARLWRFTPSTAEPAREQPLPLVGRYDLPQRRAALVNQSRGRGEV
ncbi:Glycogen synthase [Moorella humiferrea]|uniref:glycosyltransferase family 4 protein n=1 Tax=Neomoorella humiferrea TaxID=676965 RepID=UPI0030CEF2A1